MRLKQLFFLISAVLMVFGIGGLKPTYAATENEKITASDGAHYDWFGYSVAIDGDTVVVSARNDNEGGDDLGSAYVFDCSGAPPCTELDKLTASDPVTGDGGHNSYAVAVSGTIVLVGFYSDFDDDDDVGSVYVFDCSGGAPCNEIDKLTSGEVDDQFGKVFGVSGRYVVVGARWDNDSGTRAGAAYVFDCSGVAPDPICDQVQKLTASDPAADDDFGTSVAINGTTVVVGADYDDTGGLARSGSAYVFDCSGEQPAPCAEIQKLTASDAAEHDLFGTSVAVSGKYVVVGAYRPVGGLYSGLAYVFDCGGEAPAEPCEQVQILTASDPQSGDNFGFSVDISGTTVVVGARNNDSYLGSAYVFECGGVAPTPCADALKLTASDPLQYSQFGNSVAVSGRRVVVGAHEAEGDFDDRPGAAYLFSLEANPDADADGVPDIEDNCPTVFNPGQEQTGNNIGGENGDACVNPNVKIPADADVGTNVVIEAGVSIGSGSTIGAGSTIGENVTVSQGSILGENVDVGAGTTLSKDSAVGADTVIGTNCTISKEVTIGERVTVGTDVTIKKDAVIGDDVVIANMVTIGIGAMIGNGALINADVPNGMVIPDYSVWPVP